MRLASLLFATIFLLATGYILFQQQVDQSRTGSGLISEEVRRQQLRHVLPDPAVTPGAVSASVNQANIAMTICRSGYAAKSRPRESYVHGLKLAQLAMPTRGYLSMSPEDFEEDHLIPLELGGAPADPFNLWPQPYEGDWKAKKKDRLENALHRRVCMNIGDPRRLSLAQAQKLIRENWVVAYEEYVK